MRILLVHRYFWPDSPPYASMLRVMARHFAARGHEVTVLTTQPSYTAATARMKMPRRETREGYRVLRRPMLPESKRNWLARLLNVALFQWHVFWHVLLRRRRYELVTATTMPPVVVAAAAGLATRLRGGHFLYHCMDLYPEIARLSGRLPMGRGPIPAALGWLDRRNCRRAARVVVLSDDMRDTLRARGLDTAHVRVINNFALEPDEGARLMQPPPEALKPDGEVRILFAGNVGRFQGLETAVDALHELRDRPEIQLHVVGDGVARAALERRAGALLGHTIHFQGFRPLPEAIAFMDDADLGLVSLQPGVIRSAFPSKTMTYLAAGLPLLVMVEEDSALARLVREEGVGACSPQGDTAALAEAIRTAANDPEARARMKGAASALADSEFSARAALVRWDQVIAELAPSR